MSNDTAHTMLTSANGSICIAMTASALHSLPRHRQQHGPQLACFVHSHSHVPSPRTRGKHACGRPSLTRAALEEADWEEEMSLFRKRLQKPNQLETLRKIVEEVDIGKASQPASLFLVTAPASATAKGAPT